MIKKLLPLFLAISGLWSSGYAEHLSSNLLFTAKMSGAEEVPAVATDGQGVAVFSFDESKTRLFFDVSISSLSGPVMGIHIHEGAAGMNGGVIYNLTPFLQGNRVKGMLSNITKESFAKFINGSYYINAHTEMNPGGEIRGQIYLETDYRFTARLSGDNEVPAVVTDAKGLFVANLSHSGRLVSFNMVFEGLSSDVIGAHIHQAPVGVNGGVIFDLGAFIFGNVIVGTWDPTGFVDALRAGELYINVHTVNNPGGEIRGQLVLEDGILFDAVLDGDQENPPADTDGRGIGVFNVSADLTTMNYYVIVDSLSGEIMGAHFHTGIAGANGGVIVDLTDDIQGNVISGTVALDKDLLDLFLEGKIYINVHTADNPAGEIRGQVYKLAREGYLFDINGGQEVPPNNSTGTGAGMVSIDRDETNAHYMIVFSNLEGTFMSSHFHYAEPGVSGPVVFNISGSFDAFGAADGYWDGTFDQMISEDFQENEMYVNIHTDLYPGGEIRGNVIRASRLFTTPPFDPRFGNNFILSAELTGDDEVPPVATDARGLGSVYFDEDRTTAMVNVTVTGLSGPITGAHIHEGFSGVSGPVVFPLGAEGNRIHAEISGITAEQFGKFVNGAYYINVHTAANPGGEIRGQLFLDQDLSFVAELAGASEVPPVNTDATGLAVIHYTIGTLSLDVNAQWTGLSGEITGAHLHEGAAGANGPVIIDLGDLIDGNTIRGKIDLTLNELFALALGEVYLNVHTDSNPGGEIRGQLVLQNGFSFDGWMSGMQEVPIAITAGSGLAVVNVSPDLSNVDVKVVTDGISGPIGAAHFHNALVGTSGGVVLDLSGGLVNNNIGFNGAISGDVFSSLLSGEIYVNVHTAAYPAGEIRGQVFRLARDGYGFDMCPEQEVGAVNAPNATGSGVVSIDREHSNLNILVATDGLTGTINSAHFHEAPIGVNGGVVADLSGFFDGNVLAVYGIGVLDTHLINQIMAGNIYVNAHTSMHPAGEVRGQVVKEFLCELETATHELPDLIGELTLHPVPTVDYLNVTFELDKGSRYTMDVYDLSGRMIAENTFDLTEGMNSVRIDTEKLGPGFYTLMISSNGAAQAFKFVK